MPPPQSFPNPESCIRSIPRVVFSRTPEHQVHHTIIPYPTSMFSDFKKDTTMSISLLTRAASGSLLRSLWNRDRSARRNHRVGFAPAIDTLESRRALAITTPLSIGGTTVGTYFDAPTGVANLGDYVTVSIEGTKGTVVFTDSKGGSGVADGTDIQTIQILDASPDFQLTFNAAVQTANPVPYASDGVVQLGTITTANVIRGINTVRGPLRNVAVTTDPPLGFTQATAGSTTLVVGGDQTSLTGQFVSTTQLLPSSTGGTTFATVLSTGYSSGTDTTTLTLDNATPSGTTAGALTLASTIQPSFVLTQFVGVNFSNLNLKDGGGLFVDRVTGADATIGGQPYSDLGILLSQGLLAYSTIGIRDTLDATVWLGSTSTASADGRMFVENATNQSIIYLGPQTTPTGTNSKFQLTGGGSPFGATFVSYQPFDGVVNIAAPATANWFFARGVGPNAVLNAESWVGQSAPIPPGVVVQGDFAGSINATAAEVAPGPLAGNIGLTVSGNLAATARVNAQNDISLAVGGSVLQGAAIAAGDDTALKIGKGFAGNLTSGGDVTGTIGGSVNGAAIVATSALSLNIGGSIVNSSLTSYSAHTLAVAGSIRNSKFFCSEDDMSIDVQGSVAGSTFNVGYDYDLSLFVKGNLTGSSLQAGSDVSVTVLGNLTTSQITAVTSDVTLAVGGNLLNSKIVTGDNVSAIVNGSALSNTIIGDDDVSISVGRNFSGVAQSASSDLTLGVGGSVLKGSSFSSGEDTVISVLGNFDAVTASRNLRFFVNGNVSTASRIVAKAVTDWQNTGNANFGIGGRFDGLLNVGTFDAAPNYQNVTLIGGGAGKNARFYVDKFATDNLFFVGNFDGNLRMNQDLVANLNFGGNVSRITIGGRVGSYTSGNTITPVPVSISVAGKLLYLNSNSYFAAAVPGRSGTFYNNSLGTQSTGILTTGSYVKVVPTFQLAPPPGSTTPQTYSVPSAPQGFSASSSSADAPPILVTFQAPSSNGNLPIVYYEYTTNFLDGTPSWRRFDNPAQGPGTDIQLTVDSSGGVFITNTYQVSVRAVNALGSTAVSPAVAVPIIAGP